MTQKIRWGILGTGRIAGQFAQGLSVLTDAELVAVGSRSQDAANAFGDKFNAPRRHASYAALANDAEVEAIYISTPHSLHAENTLLCLQAGKAVLCEKPFAINVTQAQQMVNLARQKKIFLMEAMWTRFLPVLVKVRELLAAGVIGQVRLLAADFGFRADFNPQGRLFNPDLGGGALLDVGIYPLSLASMVLGTPNRITSLANLGQTGVDEESAFILGYPQGQLAALYTAVRTVTPQEATLMGDKGQIRIHSPWWRPSKLTLSVAGQPEQVFNLPFSGNGYNCEAAEVGRCLRAGKLESEIMPLDETLSIMQTLDELRRQWGLKYPMEA